MGTWSDIPVTSPSRTMVDLAHLLENEDEIAWALRETQFLRTRLLNDLPPIRSRLEVAFMSRVVGRHALPRPDCQAPVEGFTVDFLWPTAGLVVETDGSEHDLPSMRLADAVRDEILIAAGFRVLRFRWADVHRHHERTARRIRRALRTTPG